MKDKDDSGYNDSRDLSAPKPHTTAAKAAHFLDIHSGAVTPGIQVATTFARDDRYQLIDPAHGYSRDDSPTFVAAERTLADLENGESCRLFSSGMAAIAAIFQTLGAGSHVVLPDSLYWGVYVWTERHCNRNDIRISRYDPSDANSISAAVENMPRTDLVWVETPSNPFLHVTDIAIAAQIAHDAGARLCVDSTAATPVFTRPLDFGADLVVHSATKYLNGHSDALVGAIVTKDDHDLWKAICLERGEAGAVPGNLEAWLLMRGIRTLFVRVERAAANAMKIAEYMSQHTCVQNVLYPGLPSHPGHATAQRQMLGGFGGLLSFQVKGGKAEALKVAGSLQLIISATSLGGVETLIEHRYSIEPEITGVPENLLRLSVGIEHVDDLIADLDQALAQIQ